MGNNYAIDPMFLAALNSPNINNRNFYTAPNDATYVAQTQNQSLQLPASGNVNFEGNIGEVATTESGGSGLLYGAGAVVTGALACIYASKKGNGKGIIEGFKNIYKGIRGKVSPEKTKTTFSNILKNNKNVESFTVNKNGVSVVMQQGKPVKIITRNKKVIEKPEDLKEYLAKHTSVQTEVANLSVANVLPKGINLAYTRELTQGDKTYKFFVENGDIVRIAGKNGNGKWMDVPKKDLESFISKNRKLAEEARKLTKTEEMTVKVLDESGKLVEQTGNVEMVVKQVGTGRQLVSAKFNGREMKPEELKALRKSHSDAIGNFGKETGEKYGLTDYHYIWRKEGGEVIKFDAEKNIKAITTTAKKELTTAKEVESYLGKNDVLKSDLESIASGTFVDGYKIASAVIKSDSGVVYNISGKSINSIKLNKEITLLNKKFKSGDEISGKYLKEWRKTAENKNDYEKILEQVGS